MIQYLKKTNPSNHRRASSGSDRRRCTKTRRRRTGRSNNDTAFTSERVGGMYSYGCVCGSGGREEFLHPSQFPLQTMSSVSWIGGVGMKKIPFPEIPLDDLRPEDEDVVQKKNQRPRTITRHFGRQMPKQGRRYPPPNKL